MREKAKFKLFCLLIVFVLFGLFANMFVPESSAAQKHNFEVGTEFYGFLYSEQYMDETGFFMGINAEYEYHGPLAELLEDFVVKIDGRFAYGQVDYDGELSSGVPYKIDNIDDYVFEVRGAGGYDFEISETVTLTPYFGIGYRYLNDNAAEDPAGYERESNYFYSPLGLDVEKTLNNGWSIGANIEYDLFWSGVQKSHLSDAVSSLSDVENDQEQGYGIRGSIKVVKETEELTLVIEPFVRYWDISDSKYVPLSLSGTIIGTAFEPENNSTEFGLKISLRY